MRVWIVVLILALVSCAQKPLRQPATIDTEFFFGEVDREQSIVKLFPSVGVGGQYQYYFFLSLKNNLGRYIDIEDKDVVIISDKNEKISFTLERQLRGRYYVKVSTSEEIAQKKLDFFVTGVSLKEKFQLNIAPISRKHSKIKFISKANYKAKFQLFLADEKGRGIEIPNPPEIVVEPGGTGGSAYLVHIKPGVWEFTVTYPEHNIIMYLNVRAHGSYLEQMYRFQHVEN